MAREKRLRWGAIGGAALVVVAGLILWMAPSRPTISAQDGDSTGPLIARGYTDAPDATVVVAGDPTGGGAITELRVAEGQKVKRDEIIAVLSNYPRAEASVRTNAGDLEKAKRDREAMVSGFRVSEIAQQEAVVLAAEQQAKLKVLEMKRSGQPPDMKELEISISQLKLDKERGTLRVLKETLATDLAKVGTTIEILTAKVDMARADVDAALARSPIDGVVVQLFARQGERIKPDGIAKIIDMNLMRVFADVDEVHIGRVVLGGKVEVTFRGNATIYRGKISRVASTVKRMQRIDADGGNSTDARAVQVEIELDDPSSMPQVLGRETRVTFL